MREKIEDRLHKIIWPHFYFVAQVIGPAIPLLIALWVVLGLAGVSTIFVDWLEEGRARSFPGKGIVLFIGLSFLCVIGFTALMAVISFIWTALLALRGHVVTSWKKAYKGKRPAKGMDRSFDALNEKMAEANRRGEVWADNIPRLPVDGRSCGSELR